MKKLFKIIRLGFVMLALVSLGIAGKFFSSQKDDNETSLSKLNDVLNTNVAHADTPSSPPPQGEGGGGGDCDGGGGGGGGGCDGGGGGDGY